MPFGKYSSVCVWARLGPNSYKKWTTSSQPNVTAADGAEYRARHGLGGVLDLATASRRHDLPRPPRPAVTRRPRIDLRAEDGFTIVELLTAMVIGTIVLIATLTVLDRR